MKFKHIALLFAASLALIIMSSNVLASKTIASHSDPIITRHKFDFKPRTYDFVIKDENQNEDF
ncbi:hypothetical protein GSH19_00730 [Lactobacillus sp. S2-2]|uniref:hypothetical protein n=1 Tax=Lactobacillus sp. S2-2 TaxID=2692917 RepID=UPI001F24E970|nr:hypothetical protein [Lactobacillus sp. S2-2]MCF6514712.1 hypothetical protein [Lactobacillus sp. S2-2]